jgi:hypothetical protein
MYLRNLAPILALASASSRPFSLSFSAARRSRMSPVSSNASIMKTKARMAKPTVLLMRPATL